MRTLRAIALIGAICLVPWLSAKGDDDAKRATAIVECSRTSAFIKVQVHGDHRIGRVTIEVRDLKGRTWYKEEGKAMTADLVRLLDKGVFPQGEMQLLITGRDLRIDQHFVVR
ncbi:MAG: hypothetical protein H6597_05065 [Flavobacteriales bacterium]|nr:hypothetical protein [Flavobacteriales bacterium]MCB9193884.1 hypothetical protein [Flavobacteriales bacterium]